jgi:hypothetical protein
MARMAEDKDRCGDPSAAGAIKATIARMNDEARLKLFRRRPDDEGRAGVGKAAGGNPQVGGGAASAMEI